MPGDESRSARARRPTVGSERAVVTLGLPRWREEMFAFMHHNAQRPGAYFKIPSAQTMEIGVEFEI